MTTEQQQQPNLLFCNIVFHHRILSGPVDCSHRRREETYSMEGHLNTFMDNSGRSLTLVSVRRRRDWSGHRHGQIKKKQNNDNSKNNNHNNINININNITNIIRTNPRETQRSPHVLFIFGIKMAIHGLHVPTPRKDYRNCQQFLLLLLR